MEKKKSFKLLLGEWLGNVSAQSRKSYSDLDLISIGSNLLKGENVSTEENQLAGAALIDFVQLLMIMKSNEDQMGITIDFLID